MTSTTATTRMMRMMVRPVVRHHYHHHHYHYRRHQQLQRLFMSSAWPTTMTATNASIASRWRHAMSTAAATPPPPPPAVLEDDDIHAFQHLIRHSELEIPTLKRMYVEFTKLAAAEPGSNLSPASFKKLLLNYAASHVDSEEDVQRFFSIFDLDNDGSVSFEEFVSGIALLRADLSVAEQRTEVADFLFEVLDKDGDGQLQQVEVIEFVRAQLGPHMMSKRFNPSAVQTAVENIYRSLGWDVEHEISKSEFRRLIDSYWDSHLIASHAGI